MEATPTTIMTIKECSREYQFPEFCLRNLIKRGAFPVIQAGTRCYITKQVFNEYLEKGGAMYDPKI